MNPKIFIVFIISSLAAANIFAGGLVGNGAGLIEMNFQYTYSDLGNYIKGCQFAGKCESTGRTGDLYKKIIEIVNLNRGRADRLQFLSAKAHPEKFNLGVDEPNRIASTGLTAASQINLNVDQLYNPEDGEPFNKPKIAMLLVHEIGHQTGEKNHDLLNLLGSSIRMYLDKISYEIPFKMAMSSESLVITLVNQNTPVKMSKIHFFWENKYSMDLTRKVYDHSKCSDKESNISGYETFYAAFEPIPHTNDSINFNIWLRINCYNPTQKAATVEERHLHLTFSTEEKVYLVEVP